MSRGKSGRSADALTVVIAAGGTGGHVYPALAVAECLRRQAVRVVWLGTTAGLESRVVPRHGFDMDTVRVSGLRSGTWRKRTSASIRFVLALGAARRCLRRRRAALVLGMGGYASAPGALAARLLGLPLVLHEQNAVPGLVNRWLGPGASRLLEAFPGAFPAQRGAIHVGNPVREAILELPDPGDRLALRRGPLRVLVLGGSQGARILNQVVPQAVARLARVSPRPPAADADRKAAKRRPPSSHFDMAVAMASGSLRPCARAPRRLDALGHEARAEKCGPECRAGFTIRHQTGRGNAERTRERYSGVDGEVVVEEFIEDMAGAYAWADVVVCRAGALTVAELAAAGAASILIPFPFAADDHQARNAGQLVEAGAALMVRQEDFDASRLSRLLMELDRHRKRVLDMASAARRLAVEDAASRVARHCLEVARV